MSRRRLVLTILFFILFLAAIVGSSYLVSLLIKDDNKPTVVSVNQAQVESNHLTFNIVDDVND